MVPTTSLVLMWIKTLRCLLCMKSPLLIHELSPRIYKSRYKKDDKAKIMTQQYIKLNTRAKEIQQLNPGLHDNSQNIRPKHLIYR